MWSCSLDHSIQSIQQPVHLKSPFPGSIRFVCTWSFCYITTSSNQSVLSSDRNPLIAYVMPFSSTARLYPRLWGEYSTSARSHTMPCYSWLKVNWSDTISTVALAETEHDRSVLSMHTHTHTHLLTNTLLLERHCTFVSATRHKLELKGHTNCPTHRHVVSALQ